MLTKKILQNLLQKVKQLATFLTVILSSIHDNYAQIQPCKDASGNDIPYLLATPCYINGNSQGLGSLGAAKDGFVLWNYTNYGDGTTSDPGKKILNAGSVGSVWSVVYNPTQQKIYTSSFLKRFVSFGPNGIGAIYQIDPIASSLSSTLLVDVNTFPGVNVGTDPRVPSSGSVDDPNELPIDVALPSWDVEAFKNVGKIGMGGMAYNSSSQKLYVVNLKERNIIEMNISSSGATFSKTIPINDPGADGGDYRPWALRFHEGKLYVGIVASAETSQDDSKLMAYIVSVDPATGINSSVINFPLTFRRGAAGGSNGDIGFYWHGWTDVHKNDATDASGFWIYPQPILSDIEFDNDGSMILAFMDRAGHQGGLANFIPDASNTTTFVSAHNSGDIIRVCNSNGSFVLENNGLCPGETRTIRNGDGTFNSGEGNNQGPGGGEFYWGDFFAYNPYSNGSVESHQEVSFGGITILPGSTEIAITTMDPTLSANSGGVIKLSNLNGSRVKGPGGEDGYRLYQTTNNNDGTGGKAAGLGDLISFCPVAEIPSCTPPSPTGTGATICSGNTATLTVTGCDATYPAVWYSDATLATQVGTGNSFTSPALTVTTDYYVACVKDASCKSSGVMVVATVKPLPTISVGVPVCNGAGTAFDVSYTATAGATVTADKGTVDVANSKVTGITSGETVTLTVTLDGCEATTTATKNCTIPCASPNCGTVQIIKN